ncbi:MAG: glutamate-1-semialdehyde 2,1-aminomutase [Candidatus Bathyarchaeia archaeon]|nr:glutamate-1-semialdehyde 2,1-aminomutase [Candidatus Bathyarchaeota archaeon]
MVEPNLGQKSKELFERAKRLIPGGVNSPVRAFQPYPFFVEKAKGAKLYSVDGASYIDYCMAYGALLLGHGYEEILEPVREQLNRGTIYGAPTEIEVKFAELLSEIYPSIEMLRLVNSGTEATMHAIRLARGFTGRKKIIKFEGCYHGAHDSVLVKAGSGAAWFGAPNSLGVPEETARNTIVLPFNNIEALEETMKAMGNEVAAVIVEPVIANSGLIMPRNGYLTRLRQLTRDYDVVLIFDEIVTGFRLALGGAQQYYGVKPDMTTLGKILGGGFPLAVFGGRKDIMENIAPMGKVYQAGTFSGNPVSVAAGYAVLNLLHKKCGEIYTKLETKCERLAKALKDFIEDYEIEAQVNNIASMFQIFFTDKPVIDYASAKTANTQKFYCYFNGLLAEGVFIPPSQFETCFLSTAHTEDDINATIEAFNKALKTVKECG